MASQRQTSRIDDLDATAQERVRIRMEHVLEAETGYRSGSSFWAQPGEPRAEYDPLRTTLTQRRQAKVVELGTLNSRDAKHLGLERISERTLRRMAAELGERGVAGLGDGRWAPPLRGHASIGAEVAEAIHAVHAESLHRSKTSMRTKERMICQYVREKFGPEVAVPHYTTLLKVWKEWFGPQGARQRYARSAAAVDTGTSRVVISRPGQVVVLDTTPLPVKVLDDVFAEPISVDLTLALDAYSHSLVAFRLTPGSDSSVDVAMLLRDVMLPLPMRPDWGEEMEWPYPGVPASVVAEFAGHPVAGRPFFAPETVTSDHGSVYKNHHMVQVARSLGVVVLPARVPRGVLRGSRRPRLAFAALDRSSHRRGDPGVLRRAGTRNAARDRPPGTAPSQRPRAPACPAGLGGRADTGEYLADADDQDAESGTRAGTGPGTTGRARPAGQASGRNRPAVCSGYVLGIGPQQTGRHRRRPAPSTRSRCPLASFATTVAGGIVAPQQLVPPAR
jgi:hypothetical protein